MIMQPDEVNQDTIKPAKVVNTSPANGSTTTDTTPTLSWKKPYDKGGVSYYEVQLEYKNFFGFYVNYKSIWTTSSTSSTVTPSIKKDKYQFTVRAVDKSGNKGAWSSWHKFEVK